MSEAIGYQRVFNGDGTPGRMFYASPRAENTDAPIPWGRLLDTGDATDTGRRNAAFLKTALRSLDDAMLGGHKILMMVPISAKGLTDKEGATAIVDAAKSVEADLRGRVAIDLFDIPENPRLDALEDIVIPLMPFFDRLLARPRAEEDDYTTYANINLFGVTIDLASTGAPDLTRFWANARKRRLAIFAHGVTTPAQAEELKKFEVEGMDGPLLGGVFASMTEAGEACAEEA